MQTAQLLPSVSAEGDWFGRAVAVYGDLVVVGAQRGELAFVFRSDGSEWTEEAVLTPPASGDFGRSVATNGSLVLVGAPDDSGTVPGGGAVYVYENQGGWTNTSVLAPALLPDNAAVGAALSLRGNRFVVGANFDPPGGAAYAFELVGSEWIELGRFTGPDTADDDRLGTGVGIDGDRLAAGARLDDDRANNAGSAFVFTLFDDCDDNGVPDECDLDCNGNGVTDACDIADGVAVDCDGNGVPDECDVADGGDCNANGVPDACDLADGVSSDCDENGVPDECDPDCDGSGTPDACDLADGLLEDCNGNDRPDICETADGSATDCDGDGVPDTCQHGTVLSPAGLSANDQFGDAVAVDGDWLVAGAPWDQEVHFRAGAAYVYRFESGAWVEHQKLTAFDGTYLHGFGSAVDIEGDRLAVSAPGDATLSLTPGAVYLYRLDGGTWLLEQKIASSAPQPRGSFGLSVDFDGDLLAVGARDEDASTGAAYLFGFDGVSWVEIDRLVASDRQLGDGLGVSVALDGDQLLVGAAPANEARGAAYLFENDGAQWVEYARLEPDDLQENSRFGRSAILRGDLAIVGASIQGAALASGAVYVYERDPDVGWILVDKLTSTDRNGENRFGVALSLAGETLVAGANADDVRAPDSGATYVYRGMEGTWGLEAVIRAPDAGAGDWFGRAVDTDGAQLFVGAPYRTATAGFEGGVYVFPIYADCDDSGVADDVELACGAAFDCDGNGVIDACQEDCNGNGVLDDCDVADGTSADCNANGVPDECEVAQNFESRSPLYTPLHAVHEFVVSQPPPAASPVTITVRANGDLGDDGEFITVRLNDTPLADVLHLAGECLEDPVPAQVVLSAAEYNMLVAGGDARFMLEPSAEVGQSICGPTSIDVRVSYGTRPNDCNVNGVPDDCDIASGDSEDFNANGQPDECECLGDLDGSGAVDLADLATLLENFGEDGASYADGDLNGDGRVELADLSTLLVSYGQTCP